MPRRAKGPRLWLRPAREDGRPAIWFILDGSGSNGRVQRSTGLGQGASAEACKKALTAYLVENNTKTAAAPGRDPSQIPIADVLTTYMRDVVNGHARPDETERRIARLQAFWGRRKLSEVTGATCREYIASRSTKAAARRELEDFRAAIVHHRTEGLHDRIVSVVLPDKAPPRERWLTKKEAAALIRSAWRYREVQKGHATGRRSRMHVARFMVVASYMGSRAAVICGASIAPKRPAGEPWIDLVNGVFYGRPSGERETKKARQKVRVPSALLAHLRRWRAAGQRYAVEWHGEPVTRVTKAHNAVVAAVGLEDVTPHTWRHTVATWMMQNGAVPTVAAKFLAMSIETLLRVYGHHSPEDSSDAHKARHRRAG